MEQKRGCTTYVAKAKMLLAGFRDDYQRFIERVSIDQKSKNLVTNYGRSLAALALHFRRSPLRVGIANHPLKASGGNRVLGPLHP